MSQMGKILVVLIVATAFLDFVESKTNSETIAKGVSGSAKPKSKGSRISAWGVIFLMLAAVFLGVLAYYIAIFYPLLCKKERKYDRMQLATV